MSPKKFASKSHVLANIGRLGFQLDLIRRHASCDRVFGKYLRLASVPHPLGPIAQVAGENNQRRPLIEVEIGASLGDAQIVTPETHNTVRLLQGAAEMMVIPKDLGEMKGFIAQHA